MSKSKKQQQSFFSDGGRAFEPKRDDEREVARNSRSIAARTDTMFHLRSPRPYMRLRAICGYALGVVTFFCCVLAWYGFPQSYQSRPVAPAHGFINSKCSQCHDTKWATLYRLIPCNDTTSTSNAACTQCHQGLAHHPRARGLSEHTPLGLNDSKHCSSCHREHRGKMVLAQVDDFYCVECHGQLKVQENGKQLLSSVFATKITSWDEHPEFALTVKQNKFEKRNDKHHVNLVSEVATRESQINVRRELPEAQYPPERRAADEAYSAKHGERARADKTKLAFNHFIHLKGPLRQNAVLGSKLVTLKCDCCHVPDAGKRYMQPVTFKDHCSNCHAAQLRPIVVPFPELTKEGKPTDPNSKEAKAFDDGFTNEPVPHETPETVRGALRDRLTKWTSANPLGVERVLRGVVPPVDPPLPSRPAPPPVKVTPDHKLEAIEKLIASMQTKLFHGGGGCYYCHEPQLNGKPLAPNMTWESLKTEVKDASLLDVAKVNQPTRWLQHSVFNHDSHRFLKCDECHQDVRQSSQTSHILIPDKGVCVKCHRQGSTAGLTVPSAARGDCFECHRYHDRDHESLNGKLDAKLQQVQHP